MRRSLPNRQTHIRGTRAGYWPLSRLAACRRRLSYAAPAEIPAEIDVLDSTSELRPPAPLPQPKPLGPIALLRVLARNPLEAWTQAHFEQPIVMGGLSVGRVAVISDPAASRHVLLENCCNYQKDWLQRRVLSAGL